VRSLAAGGGQIGLVRASDHSTDTFTGKMEGGAKSKSAHRNSMPAGLDESTGANADASQRRKKVIATYEDVVSALAALNTNRTGPLSTLDVKGALNTLGITMKRAEYHRVMDRVREVEQGTATFRDPPRGRATPAPARDSEMLLMQTSGAPSGPDQWQAGSRSGARSADLPALGWNTSRAASRVASRAASRTGEALVHGRTVTGSTRGGRPGALSTGRSGALGDGGLRAAIEPGVTRHWRRIKAALAPYDPEGTGLVPMSHLLAVLAGFGVNLPTRQADLLFLQLGTGSSGAVSYTEFLRTYTQPLYRPGRASAPPPTSLPGIGGGAAARDPAALRKAKLLRAASAKWRALRQACSLLDPARTKTLPRDVFRAALLRLGIVTSDGAHSLPPLSSLSSPASFPR
jgi:Ca2+-binding EF-hand superfamily protein